MPRLCGKPARYIFLLACISSVPGAALRAGDAGASGDAIPVYSYEVINTYPHDKYAFTQGLFFRDGHLYEGTGREGESSLRKVILETGQVVKIHRLPPGCYGEGITDYRDVIYQITWLDSIAFTYVETDTFRLLRSLPYPRAGWGLCHDDTGLVASDGSAVLYHLDPVTLEETGRIDVTAGGAPQGLLNELEYIQGRIYANVFGSDSIAVIRPETGKVEAWLNLAGLRGSTTREDGRVLNGIAYDPANVRLFVTGKRWPAVYEIRVAPLDYPPEIIAARPAGAVSIPPAGQVVLKVQVRDPDPEDSPVYAWSINGVRDPAARDSFYIYSGYRPGIDTVTVEVRDAMFSRSHSWQINVKPAGEP
jgi:glutamine cyclotransferase